MSERYLDITNDSCPMTFVKAKLELEKLGAGETLEILLKGDEPLKNVPRSATESGYDVKSVSENGNGTHTLIIGK
jgi:TusA-related sulfurtransferase